MSSILHILHAKVTVIDKRRGRRHFWLQGSGDITMATKFCQNKQKSHKNSHNYSCTWHINAMFGLDIRFQNFQLSVNSSVTLPRTQRTKGRYHGNQIWDKNCYKCTSTKVNVNVITYNRGFRGWPIQTRYFWLQGSKGRCHGNQILAKIRKNLTKMAIT